MIYIILVLLNACLVYAAPTIHGPTGLIEMPTADVLRYQEYTVGIDYLAEARSVSDPRHEDSNFYKFNIGTYDNVEMGIVGGTRPDEGVFINMKYHVFEEEKLNPIGVAIGTEKLTSRSETATYIVMSKPFGAGIATHFGFRALFDHDIDASAMLGADYLITDKFAVVLDMVGEATVYRLNIGARWFVSDAVTLQAAVLDTAGADNNPQFTLGASINKFL